MPLRWMHEFLDLVAWGRSYWPLHRWKDLPAQRLGPRRHRIEHHPWYGVFGKEWDFDQPYPASAVAENLRLLRDMGPEAAERFQACRAHDFIDRCWDEISREDRIGWAAAFRAIILHPDFLKRWAGVDVRRDLVCVADYDGRIRWEREPTLTRDWRRLRSYVASRSPEELVSGRRCHPQ